MNEDCIEMIKLMKKDFVPEIEWKTYHFPYHFPVHNIR